MDIEEAMDELIEAYSDLIKIVKENLHQSYQEAGMPYGDNDEGMLRWVEECAAAARFAGRFK